MSRLKTVAGGFRDQLPDGTNRFFVSFSKGVSVVYEKGERFPKLYARDVPYTNLGLALVSPIEDRANPYAVAHKKVARRFASIVYNDMHAYYLRVVHGANDSRAMVDEGAPVPEGDYPKLLARSPLLADVLPQPGQTVGSVSSTMSMPHSSQVQTGMRCPHQIWREMHQSRMLYIHS